MLRLETYLRHCATATANDWHNEYSLLPNLSILLLFNHQPKKPSKMSSHREVITHWKKQICLVGHTTSSSLNDCAHEQLINLAVEYVGSMQVLSVHVHNVVNNIRIMSMMRPMKYLSLTRQHIAGFEFSENWLWGGFVWGKAKSSSKSVSIKVMEHLSLSNGV